MGGAVQWKLTKETLKVKGCQAPRISLQGLPTSTKDRLVSAIAGNVGETKQAAFEHASKWAKEDTTFMHGPVSRVCSSMPAHSAREVSLMVTRMVRDLKRTKPATLSRSKPATTATSVSALKLNPRWLGLSSEELNKEVLAEVRLACASVIGDDADLEDDMPLMEAGVDSLGATELVNILNGSVGLTLESTALFNHPTISQLTRHIVDRLHTALESNNNEVSYSDIDPQWMGLSAAELGAQIDSEIRHPHVSTICGLELRLDIHPGFDK